MKCKICKLEKSLDCFQKGVRKYNTWNTKCNDCRNIKRATNRKEWSKNAHINVIRLLYNRLYIFRPIKTIHGCLTRLIHNFNFHFIT